jgi:hypothetical protein
LRTNNSLPPVPFRLWRIYKVVGFVKHNSFVGPG